MTQRKIELLPSGTDNTSTDENRPLFSIILPTHNRAQLLGRAIQCVLNQTLGDFELLVIDDASTDNTEEIVNSFADKRLHFIRLHENRGVSAARNIGMLRSRGRFIIFLDDDDESYPHLLEATLEAFAGQPETVGFAWSGIRYVTMIEGKEVLLEEKEWLPEVKKAQPLVYLSAGTGYGLTVRRGCLEIVGLFDEELRSCVDLDLLIRLGSRFDFIFVPGIHVKVFRHQRGQLTDISPQRLNALEEVIRRNSELLERDLPAWLRLNYFAAKMNYQLDQKQSGRLAFLRMIRSQPLQLVIWKQFAHLELYGTSTVQGKPLSVEG